MSTTRCCFLMMQKSEFYSFTPTVADYIDGKLVEVQAGYIIAGDSLNIFV